jgi:hypothetical protein
MWVFTNLSKAALFYTIIDIPVANEDICLSRMLYKKIVLVLASLFGELLEWDLIFDPDNVLMNNWSLVPLVMKFLFLDLKCKILCN